MEKGFSTNKIHATIYTTVCIKKLCNSKNRAMCF